MTPEKPETNGAAAGSMLRWLWSSLGFAGALLVVGYIVDSARGRLLGIQLAGSQSPLDYTFEGARFFADCFNLLQERGGAIGATILLIVLLVVVVVFVLRLLKKTPKISFTPFVRMLLLALVVFAMIIKWARYDLPFAYVDDVLVVAKERTFANVSAIVRPRTLEVWTTYVCAHSGDLAARPQCQKRLESLFVRDVVWTIFLGVCVVALSASRRNDRSLPIFQYWAVNAIRVIAGGMLLINLAALPYVYGKAVKSTTFTKVALVFGDAVEEDYRKCIGLLLSHTDSGITFYDEVRGEVVRVAASHLVMMRVLGEEDVVALEFQELQRGST